MKISPLTQKELKQQSKDELNAANEEIKWVVDSIHRLAVTGENFEKYRAALQVSVRSFLCAANIAERFNKPE